MTLKAWYPSNFGYTNIKLSSVPDSTVVYRYDGEKKMFKTTAGELKNESVLCYPPNHPLKYTGAWIKTKEEDTINHPPHYTKSKVEPWDVVNEWKLDYYTGTALKYIARFQHKGKPVEDLEKAIAFLKKKVEILNEQNAK